MAFHYKNRIKTEEDLPKISDFNQTMENGATYKIKQKEGNEERDISGFIFTWEKKKISILDNSYRDEDVRKKIFEFLFKRKE